MAKVTYKEATELLLMGGIVEGHDRYYRYNNVAGKMEYSDYNTRNWKESRLTLEEFKNDEKTEALWNVVK